MRKFERKPLGKAELGSWLSTLDIWLLVFGIIVAVGVAGEAIFGVMHWRAGNQLRAIQDAEALEQQRDIEGLRKETAEANRALEAERAERVKLEAAIAPRRLSSADKQKMAAALAGVPPLPIVVVSRLFDGEGADFADDIRDVLVAARWDVQRFSNWTKSDKGVFIATVEGTPPHPDTGLGAALDAINIKHQVMTIDASDRATMSPNFHQNVLYLLVGARPPP